MVEKVGGKGMPDKMRINRLRKSRRKCMMAKPLPDRDACQWPA